MQTDPVINSPLSISALVLAILATTYALYVGKDVVLPIMLAVVLKLLLQPIMDFLRNQLRLPAAFAALWKTTRASSNNTNRPKEFLMLI